MKRADYLTNDSLPTTEENTMAYNHIQGSDNNVSYINAINAMNVVRGRSNYVVGMDVAVSGSAATGGTGEYSANISGTYINSRNASTGTRTNPMMATGESARGRQLWPNLRGASFYDGVVQDVLPDEQADSVTIRFLRPVNGEYIDIVLTRMEAMGYHGPIADIISMKYRLMVESRITPEDRRMATEQLAAREEAMRQYGQYSAASEDFISVRELLGQISSRREPTPPPRQPIPSGRLVDTKEVETTTFDNTTPLTKEESARLQKLRKAQTVVKDKLRQGQTAAKEYFNQFIGWLKK